MAQIPPGLRNDLERLQKVREDLQVVILNRQQLQLQIAELTQAIEELEKTPEDGIVYKIVGSVMVARKRDRLLAELREKKETLDIRLKTLEKQEALLKSQLEQLEKKIRGALGGGPQATAG